MHASRSMDLCLSSITMTSLATLLAMGMMPFNLWLYSRSWLKVAAVIPYKNISLTLIGSLIPVAIGYVISWKKPVIGKKITRVSPLILAGHTITGKLQLSVYIICVNKRRIRQPLLGILYVTPFALTIIFLLYSTLAILHIKNAFQANVIGKPRN